MPGVIGGSDVDAVMRRQLGGVDRDPSPVAMGELGHLVNRGDESRHVRRAADRNQADLAVAALQRMLDRFEVDVSFIREADHHVIAPMPPRQQVSVMLHLGDQDLAAVETCLFGGDSVERIGRALDEDHHLIFFIDAKEFRDQLPRLLVRLGRQPRLVSRPTVNARIEIGERGHHVADPAQGRRAGRIVEVDPGEGRAAEHRNRQVDPRKVLAPLAGMWR